jgi:hypothetical protein
MFWEFSLAQLSNSQTRLYDTHPLSLSISRKVGRLLAKTSEQAVTA